MRKSVVTGVFACVAFLSISGANAEAAPLQDVLENQTPSVTAVEVIEATVNNEEAVSKEQQEESEEDPIITTHVVGENESLSDIAKEHNTTWQRLFYKNKNVKDPDVISKGTVLEIPETDEELKEREIPRPEPVPAPAQPARVASSNSTVTSTTKVNYSSAGNGYVAGYCTWYVKSVRPDLPNTLGNAYSWFSRAASYGLPTGYTPRVGAVAQKNNHVAYVVAVHGDGTMTIKDMNYRNLYEVTTRKISTSGWRFIY